MHQSVQNEKEFTAGKKSREHFTSNKKIRKIFFGRGKNFRKTFLEKLSSSSRYIQAP